MIVPAGILQDSAGPDYTMGAKRRDWDFRTDILLLSQATSRSSLLDLWDILFLNPDAHKGQAFQAYTQKWSVQCQIMRSGK